MKKKICWITATYFLDVDQPIVPVLQKDYDIDWIVISNAANMEGDKKMIYRAGCTKFELICLNSNFMHPKTYIFYKRLLKKIKQGGYDLFYFDLSGMPYFHILAKYYLPVDKCIIAAHNVTTPKGARYYHLAKPYMEYIVRTFNKFQVFSKNQLGVLKSMKFAPEVLCAPLCLKNYGIPTLSKPANPITFLFFGNIVEYKRVDVLLEAAKILEDRRIENFIVKICGYCPKSKWESCYKPLAEKCKSVVTDIRRVPNDMIPNLFEGSHYFVMPYQDIAQSGAMTVAFCYNLPVIASELDTFKEFLTDDNDGIFFEPANSSALAGKMQFVIENHSVVYDKLRSNQRLMIEDKLADKSIIKRYKQYIDNVCQR